MLMDVVLNPVEKLEGSQFRTLGGLVSLGPPVGATGFAHLQRARHIRTIIKIPGVFIRCIRPIAPFSDPKITIRFCIIDVFFINFEREFPTDQIIHC
jgi:hypothetical protein